MAENIGGSGRKSPSPGGGRRQRAPTITIDTSAVSNNSEMSNAVPLEQLGSNDGPSQNYHTAFRAQELPPPGPAELRGANSFDSRESRPTSPHNVSSPTFRSPDPHNFLSVPMSRSRGNSLDSTSENGQSSASSASETYVNSPSIAERSKLSGNLDGAEILNDEEALRPSKDEEADFHVEDNKFAFSPGQLKKLFNPKSLGAFHALGGLSGLERGLRTDRQSGLSMEEKTVDGYVSFEEASAQDVTRTTETSKSTHRVTETTDPPHVDPETSFVDRKRVFGVNEIPARPTKTFLQLAWMAYNDKVIIMLTAAAIISLALGLYQTFGQKHEPGEPKVEWVEGVAIIVAILIVVIVGALNDWQKERQFARLNRKKEDRNFKVIRSGITQQINVHDILVGDVCHLEPGEMVPADGIFIEGHNVKCDESSATGESDLLKKTPADDVFRALENHQSVRKMDPFILSGAKVSEGVGTFLVTAVGPHSTYGQTMMSLNEESETTPLQMKLNTLAEYIAKLGGAAALALFVVLFIEFLVRLRGSDQTAAEKGQDFLNILIVAITVIVVAVPEGLPLAVTLALAFATTRMMKDNNLVRVLRSCETMGNATTVCSDKTGTLTQNKMSVVAGALGTALRFGDKTAMPTSDPADDATKGKAPAAAGADVSDVSPSEFVSNLSSEVKSLLVQSIAINSTAYEGQDDGKPAFIGSKTETALLSFARDYLGMGPVSTERSNAPTVQFVPFDSGRKCMAAVVKLEDGRYRMYVKGASEILLEKCTRIIADPTEGTAAIELQADKRKTITDLISTYASRSLRTIGLLFRDFDSWPPKGTRRQEDDPSQAEFDDVFKDMTFLAVVGIQDPLREGVREAVEKCQKAGVFVRMVTGDNVLTAKAIANDCGILHPGGLVLEGPKFRKMSRMEMRQVIPKLCVLARSSPEDKRILVKTLKEMGETVAVTGDGTNDAPALKTADVGFSMGIAGTEVAKEASAIILMDDNFSSIVKALLWGRAVNDAVKKFLQFQITVNITAVFLTFVSAVASSDQESVLSAVQLLWVNLIMDTFAALALATDPPTPSLLERKPETKKAPLISITMWKMIIGQAIYQLVVTFVLHFAGEKIFSYESEREKDQMSTVVFNTFVWMQIFNQLNNRRLDNKFNIFEGLHRNYFFMLISLIMVGGQVLIIFIGGAAFKVNRLNGAQWGYSIVLGAISIPIGVIIRLIPDELIRKLIPDALVRKSERPEIMVEGTDFQWNPALMEIRNELQFYSKIRGGRISSLKYKVTAPFRRSDHSLPSTPLVEGSEHEHLTPTPSTPDSKHRVRTRSRSNSAFGPAAAMAGVIAGSIAGWSPIDRGHGDDDSLRFTRSRSKSDLEGQEGIDLHPDTRPDDPVIVGNPQSLRLPPSQSKDTTPDFPTGPFSGYPNVERGPDNGKGKDASP